MSLEADRQMTSELPAGLKPALEFGPIQAFWVIFETVAMPAIVLLFCLFQVRLFVDDATWGKKAKNP